jgi:carbamoylphosphate synthase small subunit
VGLANSIEGIEIIKHKDKPIYGFQFHPEMFPNLSDGDELFANIVKIVQNRGT